MRGSAYGTARRGTGSPTCIAAKEWRHRAITFHQSACWADTAGPFQFLEAVHDEASLALHVVIVSWFPAAALRRTVRAKVRPQSRKRELGHTFRTKRFQPGPEVGRQKRKRGGGEGGRDSAHTQVFACVRACVRARASAALGVQQCAGSAESTRKHERSSWTTAWLSFIATGDPAVYLLTM